MFMVHGWTRRPGVAVWRLAVSLGLGALCALLAGMALAQTYPGYQYASQFGTSGTGPGQFQGPAGVAIDSGLGRLIVTDAGNARVQIFTLAGAFVKAFGKSGSGDGEFSSLQGVAVDPVSHDILVADTSNYGRVQIFDSEGTFKKAIGPFSYCDSTCYPIDVAISPRTRNITILDGYNNRVDVYDTDGKYVDSFGAFGTERRPGFFNSPAGIAIDPTTGGIVVADPNRVLVHIFDAFGRDQIQIRGTGSTSVDYTSFLSPLRAAIDPVSHHILFTEATVSDGIHSSPLDHLHVMTAAGTYLGRLGFTGSGNGQFKGPVGVAIDPATHKVYVADSGNDRIQVFAPTGTLPSGNAFLRGLALSQGALEPGFDISTFNYTALVPNTVSTVTITPALSDAGASVKVNGVPLAGGAAAGPIALAVGTNAIAVEVTARNTATVLTYSITVTRDTDPAAPQARYRYLGQFGSRGAGNGEVSGPFGVAIDPATRNRVVVDSYNQRVQVFGKDGAFVRQFGSAGTGDGQFNYPFGVAIDPVSRDIVVTDTGNQRVQVFGADGTFKLKFGSTGTSDGQFKSPGGVAIDPKTRNIVVIDQVNHSVQTFTAAGVFFRVMGLPYATGSTTDYGSQGVAIDPDSGNLVIADKAADQVVVYSQQGALIRTIGGSGSADGKFYRPVGVAIDPVTHNIFVTDTDAYASAAHIGQYGDASYRVQVFTSTGVFAGKFGFPGPGNGQFKYPSGIAIDPVSHHVVVVDSRNYRVETFAPIPPFVSGTVVEYYNPDLDNYFITADPAEQTFVDTGAVGRWQRTGNTFNAGGPDEVCRFYGNGATNPSTGRIYGPNSHFYTVIKDECAGLKALFSATAASWSFESNDFATTTPLFAPNDGTTCPDNLVPVYRAYNNGFARGVDSNHRITTNLSAYQNSRAAGWIGEGIVMCAP